MARILLIDDDQSLREVVQFMLTEAGHEILTAGSGEAGLKLLDRKPDLVLTDIRMPGMDGMEVLRNIRESSDITPPPVIVLTAHGTVEQAVQAMRLGAFTYLLKPFSRDEIVLTVEQALHTGELEQDNIRLRRLLKEKSGTRGIVHRSRVMTQLLDELGLAAQSDATVMITGESGTGKELVARACHDRSDRWDKAFVAVNCGAIPADLMESVLFGHAKGAFTGAGQSALGKVRAAEGGTLFLDEIAELPLELQPKLLRVLEAHQVDPVGETKPVDVDFRLVCATNRDLEQEVAAGRFREDLLYRVNVLQLNIPPLRQRPDDVAVLWHHFTEMHGGSDVKSSDELLAALKVLPWRGNVRELKNLNQRLVLLSRSKVLGVADLKRLAPNAGNATAATASVDAGDLSAGVTEDGELPLAALPPGGFSLPELEKEVVRRALELCSGNRSKTAVYLGIPRHVLVYRISKYELG